MVKKLGSILASHRKEKKISQIELAEQLSHYGVSVSNAAISAWEKDTSVPNANQFLALCKILGITNIYNEFIGFNPDDVLAKLNDEGKAKALEYIGLLLLSEQFQQKEATIIPFRRTIKWSLLQSSAGTGEFLDDENFETLNGFMISKLEHIPEIDEFFEMDYGGYHFKALEIENKIFKTISVVRNEINAEENTDEETDTTIKSVEETDE